MDWTGAILVTACVVLTVVFFGLLFRPLTSGSSDKDTNEEAISESTADEKQLVNGDAFRMPEGVHGDFTYVPPPVRIERSLRITSLGGSVEKRDSFAQEIKLNGEPLRPLASQFGNGIVVASQEDDAVERLALSHPVISVNCVQNLNVQFGSHSRIYDKKRHRGGHRAHHGHGHGHHHPEAGVMFRKDIFYGGSLYNIPEYKWVK